MLTRRPALCCNAQHFSLLPRIPQFERMARILVRNKEFEQIKCGSGACSSAGFVNGVRSRRMVRSAQLRGIIGYL